MTNNPDPKSPLDAIPGYAAFKSRYADDDACRERLFEIIWPKGFKCPRCGAAEYDYLSARKLYQCKSCHFQASVTAKTTLGVKLMKMHKSHLPLHKWFRAIFLLSHNKDTRPVELQRELDVSYQTAYKIKFDAKIIIEQDKNKFFARHRELFAAIAGVEPENLGKASLPAPPKAEPN